MIHDSEQANQSEPLTSPFHTYFLLPAPFHSGSFLVVSFLLQNVTECGIFSISPSSRHLGNPTSRPLFPPQGVLRLVNDGDDRMKAKLMTQ